jgi:hypothetical protein
MIIRTCAAAAAAALLVAGGAHATCYSIYKADGTILLETSVAPVDLSQQIGDTVPVKFGPGTTMTMSGESLYCKESDAPQARDSLAEAVRSAQEKELLVKAPAPKEAK